MKQPILPTQFAQDTIEYYFYRNNNTGNVIYISVILFLLVFFSSTPFLYIDVYVRNDGIVRSVSEKTEIKSNASGRILKWNISENKFVKKRQILLQIESVSVDEKLQYNKIDQQQQSSFIEDLTSLVANTLEKNIATSLYRQQWSTYLARAQAIETEKDLIQREFNTDRKLYSDHVISRQDFEKKENLLIRKMDELVTLKQEQRAAWEVKLREHQLELMKLKTEKNQLEEEKKLYTLYAPVSGTLQQVSGKYEGGYLSSGDVLGHISPDTSLIGECYINPSDIGLIRKMMKVNFQVEAFNYTEWGVIQGVVTDIGNDFILINDTPVFKIKCKFFKDSLSLKNGIVGHLKKGMKIRGQFIVAKRSIFQLLYDKIDDWINPMTSTASK